MVEITRRILINKIRCRRCGEILESVSMHDFKICSCGAVAIDGGREYLRRCGYPDDWEELSEYREVRKRGKVIEVERKG